jgi:FkbM family methyltransferase
MNKGARWIVGSSDHGCWLGTYEHEKQTLVAELLHPGMVVWDVGANAGFYTLAFSRSVGPTGRVYAFEPFAENVSNLLRHIHLNGISNTNVIQSALIDRTGMSSFQITVSKGTGRISETDTAYMVSTITVDDFIALLPDARPQLLKIDVEGAECALLSGAKQLLSEHAPEILLALHGEAESQRCQEILHSHGYMLFYLDGTTAEASPLRSGEIYARKPVACSFSV